MQPYISFKRYYVSANLVEYLIYYRCRLKGRQHRLIAYSFLS